MKLYELEWGVYPRRIGIYLAEKGFDGLQRVGFDALAGWPPPELRRMSVFGTLPILEIGEGALVRTSVAILEYLEEVLPAPDMIGSTALRRARTREAMGLVEEVTTLFGLWCRQASPLFAGKVGQSPAAAGVAADAYHTRLRTLDALLRDEGPFIAGERVTVADCMAASTLQFASMMYDVAIPVECSALQRWYTDFGSRPSARPPAYPEAVLALTRNLTATTPEIAWLRE